MNVGSRAAALAALALLLACQGAPPGGTEHEGALELTWENLFTNSAGVRAARVSPDGSRVAIAGIGPEGSGIYRATTTGTEAPEFWVEGGGPVWFPDGDRIVYRHAGDLWSVTWGGGAPVRITHDELDERAPQPSPDGRSVAFMSTRSGHQDLWVTSADGSGSPRQLTEAAMAVDDPRFAPQWSPDGTRIAYVSNAVDYWEDDVWVLHLPTGRSQRVSQGLMVSSSPRWSPDGTRLALMGTSKDEYWYEDLAYLYVLDPDGGTERVVDMQIWATDWLHNHDVYWSADGSELFFPYMERGAFDIWQVPVQGGIATRVTNVGGALRSWHASEGPNARMALVRETPTRGRDLDVGVASGGTLARRTAFAPSWAGVRPPQEISYRSWDGLYIQGFLFLPPDFDGTRTYPALVNVHGGGTNSYLQALNPIEQTLAATGYVVLAVNYRGGSGFGRAFQDLGVEDWANGQARDAAAAADFLRAQAFSNGRVGIYGYSYGGITSMAAIARVPEAFDAAVPMAGIYDFGDAYTNADRLGKIFIRTGHGGSPEERPEVYAVSNTLARVEQIETPLLVMHGEEDVRAPYRQFELVVERLRAAGKDFSSHSYPGEPHGFRDPQNRIDLYRRLEAFFGERLVPGGS